MSTIVKKEIVEDPEDIDNSDVEEDRFLKVSFHGFSEDVLIEKDGRVLFEDITLIDSISVGLFIQNDAIRTLLKPVNGYFEEPKEKWESFRVFAVSRTEFEIIEKKGIKNADGSFQNDFNTIIETEPVSDQESQSSHKSDDRNLQSPTSLAFASDVVRNVDKTIKTEADSFDAAMIHESPLYSNDAQARAVTVDREIDNSNQNSPFSIKVKLSSDFSSLVPSPTNEPTMEDVLAAYKVSSLKQLRLLLCRGDYKYWDTFDRVMNLFKRTMIAYPNNEMIRILHCIKKSNSNIMLKTLDPNASEECEICDNYKNPLINFGHFFSSIHSDEYHKKFNADPPEIAKFLEPEIYMKLIDPKTLAILKLAEYNEMEETPKFSIDHESSSNFQSNEPSSSLLVSASGVVQRAKKRIETEADSLNVAINQESPDSSDVQVPSITVDPVTDNSIQNSPFSIDVQLSSEFLTESNAISTTATSVTVPCEPSMKDVLDSYKVSSDLQLKFMLCRGDDTYSQTFDLVKNAFKKTMITNPNNEIVRILHWIKKSNILVKDLDPTASEECDICNVRVNTFNIAHLISQLHATQYQIRFNADPPQIAKILEPEIYMKFINSQKLASLKFTEYQAMEESPEFSIDGLCSGILDDAFRYKYSLIHQILSKNLKLKYKKTFSVPELLYLMRNVYKLKDHFNEVQKCKICKKKSANTDPEIIVQHIFSPKHIKKALNQKELDFICKGLYLLDSESNVQSMKRKRLQETAYDYDIKNKRSKMD